MAKDLVYYFDKNTKVRALLGEIQTNFNIGITIDGTKDSCKINVLSFNKNVIEPNTIIYHAFTNTWWVVSSDNVDRYPNENQTFVYIHKLQLVGAIELLNARDLTDSGFYQNNYTFYEFIQRLVKLSNFEFNSLTIITNNNIDTNTKVDYIKSFENYTLLSALREFLDGYNLVGKLTFNTSTTNDITTLDTAKLELYSKSGNVNNTMQMSAFTDNRENRSINKNSYGTCVISNAENVISTKSKTYPAIGKTKLSSNSNNISSSNAVVRLPSNIKKVNWIKISRPTVLVCSIIGPQNATIELFTDANDKTSFDKKYVDFANRIKQRIVLMGSYGDLAYQYVINHKNELATPYTKSQTSTLYSGWSYNPISQSYVAPTNNTDFYFANIYYTKSLTTMEYNGPYVIAEKEVREGLQKPNSCIYYSKGSNYITGFNFLRDADYTQISNNICLIKSYADTDLRDASYDNGAYFNTYSYVVYGITIELKFWLKDIQSQDARLNFSIYNTKVIVNYVPMSDLKIKTDNMGYGKDTHLYNQNGKLTDSVALSKLINSYSKEIQSDNITKYGYYYNFANVPSVGTIVNDTNGEKYVISNVSCDFAQNENYEYYISATFTISRFVATKSLNINPNTNIRDYGIPQSYNVVRKQVYRDFYELDKSVDTNQDNNKYLALDKVLNVGNKVQNVSEHIAVMRMTFDSAYGTASSDKYYYQLDTTTYMLKKAFYEVVNFKDNNIIGYGSQNVFSGFDISRIFTGMTDLICTPISYVDDNGKVKDMDICFTTIEQITEIYDKYVERKNEQLGTNYSGSLYNYSVFIDSEIFEGAITTDTYSYSGEFDYEQAPALWYNAIIDLTEEGIELSCPISELSATTINVSWGSATCTIVPSETRFEIDSDNHYILHFRFNVLGTTSGEPSVNLVITRTYRTNGALQNNDFIISEINYKKDPIEVPFFEYGFQIDDTENVLIGENVLDNNESDLGYFYQFIMVDKGKANNYNFTNFPQPHYEENDNIVAYDDAIKLAYNDNNEIELEAYEYGELDQNNDTTYDYQLVFESLHFETKDMVVVRVSRDSTHKKDLMFVIHNPNDFTRNVANNKLYIKINHYKLN